MTDLRIELILGTDFGKECDTSVEVNMMDYSFVESCKDIPTLKEILRVLVSGKEGKFPHLEEATVEKILSLLPQRDRNRIVSMTSKVSPQDIENHKEALSTWIENLVGGTGSQRGDDDEGGQKKLFFSSDYEAEISSTERRYPPVRQTTKTNVHSPIVKAPVSKDLKKEKKMVVDGDCLKSQRISKENLSNRDYFRAWDRFDYDGAERRVDECGDNDNIEDNKKALQPPMKEEKWKSGLEKERKRTMKQLEQIRKDINSFKLSHTERRFMATREKDKGNEYFRNKEYEKSYDCYSKSLALDDSNAVVYANRAMVCIRLSNLCQATSDCTQALSIDPHYTKALARRGMVHHKCGRFSEAKKDFSMCVNQEPMNKEYSMLLKRSTEKEVEVNGDMKHERNKKKIVIVQDDDSDSDDSSNSEPIEEIFTPGALKWKEPFHV